jgi:hypothetical protein
MIYPWDMICLSMINDLHDLPVGHQQWGPGARGLTQASSSTELQQAGGFARVSIEQSSKPANYRFRLARHKAG